MRVCVRKIHYVFFAPISNDVIAYVDMSRALSSHKISGHVDTRLVVFAEEHRFCESNAEFFETGTQSN